MKQFDREIIPRVLLRSLPAAQSSDQSVFCAWCDTGRHADHGADDLRIWSASPSGGGLGIPPDEKWRYCHRKMLPRHRPRFLSGCRRFWSCTGKSRDRFSGRGTSKLPCPLMEQDASFILKKQHMWINFPPQYKRRDFLYIGRMHDLFSEYFPQNTVLL